MPFRTSTSLIYLPQASADSRLHTGFTTSHGYQFNSWLYVGGGAGCEYNLSWKDYTNNGDTRLIIPLFAEARLDGKWGRFTPFFSTRIGANLADHGGIYFSPTVGYRFNWGRRSAINLGIGMTLYGYRASSYEHIMHPEGGITLGPIVHYQAHLVRMAFRLGFEFQAP